MKKRLITASLAAVTALSLAACTANGSSGEDSSPESSKSLSIAVVEGWDETVGSTLLWEKALTEQGYDVTLEYVDIGVAFLGVAQADYDVYLAATLPNTHQDYYDEHKDNIEVLGAWNHELQNFIAVNADAPIDSLEELAANADLFDNKIVGIESGAGLTRMTETSVIPTYGLDDMDLLLSSTPVMLAELKSATDNGENIAVTLWRPHWAYNEFPIKNLEDPLGGFAEPEDLVVIARDGFTNDFPEVASWLENFEMGMDMLIEFENDLFVDNEEGVYDERLDDWVAKNQDYFDSLTS